MLVKGATVPAHVACFCHINPHVSYMWPVITCPCTWYLLLAHKSSYQDDTVHIMVHYIFTGFHHPQHTKSSFLFPIFRSDNGYFDKDAYKEMIVTAWIPLLDANEANGCMQVTTKNIAGRRKSQTPIHWGRDKMAARRHFQMHFLHDNVYFN